MPDAGTPSRIDHITTLNITTKPSKNFMEYTACVWCRYVCHVWDFTNGRSRSVSHVIVKCAQKFAKKDSLHIAWSQHQNPQIQRLKPLWQIYQILSGTLLWYTYLLKQTNDITRRIVISLPCFVEQDESIISICKYREDLKQRYIDCNIVITALLVSLLAKQISNHYDFCGCQIAELKRLHYVV